MEKLSLTTLKGGAVVEAVDCALQEVFDNIVDPNTEPTVMREVTLKIKIKPTPERDMGTITYQAIPKLAPAAPQTTTVLIDKDARGQAVALERQIEQARPEGKVVSIK